MKTANNQKQGLAQEATDRLREMILARPEGAQLGSLREVAEQLGVGIVTLQQAARVLEHEGLLTVKRGPGGGYYGSRPDSAALERAFDTYIRVHGFGYLDAMEMLVLLDCEFIPRAAEINDAQFRERLRALAQKLDTCLTQNERVDIEIAFRELLFSVIDRPFIRFLANMTMHTTELYQNDERRPVIEDDTGVAEWSAARKRIFNAILQGDSELARFEAQRFRDLMLPRLKPI